MPSNGLVLILGADRVFHIVGQHRSFGILLLAGAAMMGILGVSLAAQALARSRHQGMCWAHVARGYAGASWIVPVAAVIGIYVWLAPFHYSGRHVVPAIALRSRFSGCGAQRFGSSSFGSGRSDPKRSEYIAEGTAGLAATDRVNQAVVFCWKHCSPAPRPGFGKRFL